MRKLEKSRLLIVSLAFLLLAVVYYVVSYCSGQQVLVQCDPTLSETVYSFKGRDNQKISFTVFQSEANRSVLRWRSDSTLTLNEQLTLASRLLARIKQDRELASFESLFVGRLVLAFGSDTTFSRRLTAAAQMNGLISASNINQVVIALANKNNIYPELQELFKRYSLSVKMSGVEKVLTNDQHLPFDCLTWFLISPIEIGGNRQR